MDVQKKSQKTEKHHPGYGEGGKFHNRKEENPLPEGETLTFALVGNQNCGKMCIRDRIYGNLGFPALGVAGASIATVIGQFVAFAIAISVILKGNGFLKLEFRKGFKPDRGVLGDIPVSYTHLDVYKRQAFCSLKEQLDVVPGQD